MNMSVEQILENRIKEIGLQGHRERVSKALENLGFEECVADWRHPMLEENPHLAYRITLEEFRVKRSFDRKDGDNEWYRGEAGYDEEYFEYGEFTEETILSDLEECLGECIYLG